MKKNYTIHFLLLVLLFNSNAIIAQSTEDFESETAGATNFTDSGQGFTITNGSGETTYDIEPFANGGWNGSSPDNQFIDNSSGTPNQNDGTSFTITTTDGTDITIKSLYLFVSKRNLTAGVSTTLTIEGKRNGATIYTIVKNSGIIDGANFTPNNGFNFINFSTEGSVDNSNKNVDELIISATGNGDYLALDAFTWSAEVLSTNNFEIAQNKIKIFPNPSSELITISGLKKDDSYKIYNVLGSIMDKGIIHDKEKINIQNLNNGLYFLKFDQGNTIKFIKK
ncbi:T9SS type A sorting domain-containing protein [Algibacter sp. L4_22]|uniref:T9SS type A sorting domain-containing protein n=1 Tax=Algibacter sp. L4_22 TaxID=2942477 RepID=UPI00201B8BB8|nr:T9SS type A sorting domain-containing protein [Algibacter sp. L4_22]MCL5130205.1 T9SS type A sorting domain-containing protein [Algibacter sp. L4_22]